ncbi:hypothetical protein LAWI1_G007608 [Lachnellula willkommii]|uniref:AB hydrolase-1 domain-containing protein n=1 Tax=Lachnellula willkommii TaxID=215461 RepID=A0A559MC73_9HELO|nr:hypothetical protein LAWI1_G007608 [Lachnellula willkommii]
MASKPTIALVPGAWHTPAHFDALSSLLNAEGYPTASKQLPSVDTATPNTTTTQGDSQFIVDQVLTPLLDDGKDIILLVHSYGGSPGGAAANGLSKAERTAAGKKGGIIGLIYVAAFIAPNNISIHTLTGGKFRDWVQIDTPSAGYTFPRYMKEILFNDVPDEIANVAIAKVKKMSTTAVSTNASAPGWANPGYQGRLAYVRTALDNAIAPTAQDRLIKNSGVTWDVHAYNTSHSPFLSHPQALVQTIDTLAKRWSC